MAHANVGSNDGTVGFAYFDVTVQVGVEFVDETWARALEADGVETPSLSPPAAPPTAERSPRTLEPHERWNPAETPGNPLRAPLAPLRDEAGDGATALFDADGLPHDTDTVSDGDSDADETLSLSEPVPG